MEIQKVTPVEAYVSSRKLLRRVSASDAALPKGDCRLIRVARASSEPVRPIVRLVATKGSRQKRLVRHIKWGKMAV